MSALDLKEALIKAWPPGSDSVIDWDHEDGPGPLAGAIGEVLSAHGEAQIEALQREGVPSTAEARLPSWEAAMAMDQTAIALHGTTEERRAQVISRLREFGSTLAADDVRAVLQPYLRYADPSEIEVVQHPRADMRALHTYSWSGSGTVNAGGYEFNIRVLDSPKVGPAGAQVDLTFSAAVVLRNLSVTLRSPAALSESTTITMADPNGVGHAASAATVRLCFPGAAGWEIFGDWIIRAVLSSGSATLTGASLFVEGRGRDSAGIDGRGAIVHYWSVIVDPDKLGSGADVAAARAALARINYASLVGRLAYKPASGAARGAICDDTYAICDQCVAG